MLSHSRRLECGRVGSGAGWDGTGAGCRLPAALIVADFELAPLAHRQTHLNVVKSFELSLRLAYCPARFEPFKRCCISLISFQLDNIQSIFDCLTRNASETVGQTECALDQHFCGDFPRQACTPCAGLWLHFLHCLLACMYQAIVKLRGKLKQ